MIVNFRSSTKQGVIARYYNLLSTVENQDKFCALVTDIPMIEIYLTFIRRKNYMEAVGDRFDAEYVIKSTL